MTDRTKTDKITDGSKGSLVARRDLFRAAGLGVGALGVAAAGVAVVAEPAEAAATDTTTGYRETDHVRKVYELSRF